MLLQCLLDMYPSLDGLGRPVPLFGQCSLGAVRQRLGILDMLLGACLGPQVDDLELFVCGGVSPEGRRRNGLVACLVNPSGSSRSSATPLPGLASAPGRELSLPGELDGPLLVALLTSKNAI